MPTLLGLQPQAASPSAFSAQGRTVRVNFENGVPFSPKGAGLRSLGSSAERVTPGRVIRPRIFGKMYLEPNAVKDRRELHGIVESEKEGDHIRDLRSTPEPGRARSYEAIR